MTALVSLFLVSLGSISTVVASMHWKNAQKDARAFLHSSLTPTIQTRAVWSSERHPSFEPMGGTTQNKRKAGP